MPAGSGRGQAVARYGLAQGDSLSIGRPWPACRRPEGGEGALHAPSSAAEAASITAWGRNGRAASWISTRRFAVRALRARCAPTRAGSRRRSRRDLPSAAGQRLFLAFADHDQDAVDRGCDAAARANGCARASACRRAGRIAWGWPPPMRVPCPAATIMASDLAHEARPSGEAPPCQSRLVPLGVGALPIFQADHARTRPHPDRSRPDRSRCCSRR
jgi:hypothetical protein